MPCHPDNAHDRLRHVVSYASAGKQRRHGSFSSIPLTEPRRIREVLTSHLGEDQTVVVTGTLDRRLVLVENKPGEPWTAADLSGQPHLSREWPQWTSKHVTVVEPAKWLSPAWITEEGLRRLLKPRILLVSLYHPEYFPLPRFPLAISDLARAARATLLGNVDLMDMQLGATLSDIIARLDSGTVDVLGLSVTFGQHDLAVQLLDEVVNMAKPPLIVAGGSLTARNERILLDRYPKLIIGRGAGEPTIADVLAHWHGDLPVQDIRGAGYRSSDKRRQRTATVANRLQTDIWPELDLLDATFTRNGVAQLETSRGCTNFCSFCPRSHKGQWAGTESAALPWILQEMGAVFDRHPSISKTMYLVDEEFIGRGAEAVSRARRIAGTLASAGFTWETSCRIDQVTRPDRDRDWHIERGHLWRDLVNRGLRRCLFGVESGVDSILARFNKETTGHQNVLAIRTLTALGVPPRFTYITFDQLMDDAELRATYEFQGRTNLLLRTLPDLTVEEIVDGVRDDAFVARHTTGKPCVDARYADWRIGVLARHGQLWIDRNFALDYTLKSIEKVITGRQQQAVRDVRKVLKTTAYRLLGSMLDAVHQTHPASVDHSDLEKRCSTLSEALFSELRGELESAMDATGPELRPEHRDLLQRERIRWATTTGWHLINAADPCGT
jgi:hypothetical protein